MEPEKERKEDGQEAPEEAQTIETVPDKSNRNFYILLGILIITIAAIIFLPRMFEKEDSPKTLDDLIEETIKEGETEYSRVYNGYVFVNQSNIWYSQILVDDTLYSFGTRFNPYQVENVTIEGNVDDAFRKTRKVYLTFDPTDPKLTYINLAAAELSLNLARGMGLQVEAACMAEHPDCIGKEIITCENATSPTIALIRDDDARLVMDGLCMEIRGDGFELLRVVDRVIFQSYGIMS